MRTPSTSAIFRAGFAILALASLSGFSPSSCRAKPTSLTVIGISDFHGAIEAEKSRTQSGEVVPTGGAALLAAHLKILRAHLPGPSVLVDGGDLFQGSMESNLAEGAPVIELYNFLGVSAAAIGNHEFDFGPEGEATIPNSDQDDPRGALKARIREAKFPFLAANLFDREGARPDWVRASIVTVVEGVRVGIIGASTTETPNTTLRANVADLQFEDPLAPVQQEAQRLRRVENVDAVVLTIHDGGKCTNNRLDAATQDDLSSCDNGSVFKLVRALPEGLIDAVVAGHTHQGIAKRIGKTVILQAYHHGTQLAWATIPLGEKKLDEIPEIKGFESVCGRTVPTASGPSCLSSEVTKHSGETQPAVFLGQVIAPDPATLDLIQPSIERVKVIKEEAIGVSVTTDFKRDYLNENALGNLVTDLMREGYPDADLALTNNGGLRADWQRGPLTYGDIFNVLPFDNRIAFIQINGQQLKQLVELGIDGTRGWFSWSGLEAIVSHCKVQSLHIRGAEWSSDRSYRIVTNDYLATGGSGVSQLSLRPDQIEILWNGPTILRDMTAARLRQIAGTDLESSRYFNPQRRRIQVPAPCIPNQPE